MPAENPDLWGNVRLHVWFALADGAPFTLDDAALGRLDAGNVLEGTGTAGPEGRLWVDVSCDVLDVTTHVGATSAEGVIVRAEAGTATITMADPDRYYDPVSPQWPRLKPGMEVLVWAEHGFEVAPDFIAEYAPIFMGRVESIIEPWSPHPSLRRSTIVASDGTADLVAADRAELATPVGAGELGHQRVDRILDAFSGPPRATWWLRNGGVITPAVASTVAMQATTLAGNAWEELNRVADAEAGFVFVKPLAGDLFSTDWTQQVQFLPRSTWSNETDDPLTLPCDVVIGARVTASDGQQRTRVTAQRALLPDEDDDTAIRVERTRSVPSARPIGYTRRDLDVAETEVAAWAEFVLASLQAPRASVDSVTLRPGALAGFWTGVLRIDLALDRVRLEWRPPDGGDEIAITGRVIGVAHTITRASWTVDWHLADVVLVATGFLLNEDLDDLLTEDGASIRLS